MNRAAFVLVILLLPSVAAARMLSPDDAFPAWKMKDHTGKNVSSADMKGRSYLLWFYPKAMTPGCTIEGHAFTASYPEFKKRNVEVFGVSFDDPKANAEFVKNEGFPFRLLADADHRLALAVGAADSADQTHARRISYLVGGDGKVRKAYADVKPAKHATEVLADLEPAQGAERPDIDSPCEKSSDASARKTCTQRELAAKAALEKRSVHPKIAERCERARVANGGSYLAKAACVQEEVDALKYLE